LIGIFKKEKEKKKALFDPHLEISMRSRFLLCCDPQRYEQSNSVWNKPLTMMGRVGLGVFVLKRWPGKSADVVGVCMYMIEYMYVQ
jgi:hypothetical protein